MKMNLNLNRINKEWYMNVLLFLVFCYVVYSSKGDRTFGTYIGQMFGTIERNVEDGLVTLAIKFLHFFIAKMLQFRTSIMTLAASYPSFIVFWVAFTRAISSMPDNPL
ncbi:hypothetical protein ACFE04_015973 [Oxalis oulophora]